VNGSDTKKLAARETATAAWQRRRRGRSKSRQRDALITISRAIQRSTVRHELHYELVVRILRHSPLNSLPDISPN